MPSPGSAVLNCATAAKKVLPLPLPVHGERLHKILHRQMRRVFPVQDGLHKGRRQVSQPQDAAHERWADVLGLGQVLNRRVGAVEQFAMPAVAARDEFDHGVVNERLTALDGMSEELRLSTLAHEMGHAIFDGPALVSHHQNQPLADLRQEGTVRAFRLVTETQTQLQKADNLLPSHIRFAELRANEFMGSLLVPRELLWDAVMEEAPKHALEIRYGEDTLFAETPDGEKKIVWSEVTYDMDCWSFTGPTCARTAGKQRFYGSRERFFARQKIHQHSASSSYQCPFAEVMGDAQQVK